MGKQLTAEDYLLPMFDQADWVLKVGRRWDLMKLPSWDDVRYLAKHFGRVLAGWQKPLLIQYGKNQIVGINKEGEIMEAQIDGLRVNRELLDIFGEMLSNPDKSIGLVRLSDEKQISVSGGANGKFLVGASIDEVTQWTRDQYWHPEDLFNFNHEWRQQMSAGSDRWFEWKYRSFDPLAENPGPDKCDYWFTTKYRLIEGPQGEMFHVAENLDMEAIAA